MSQNSTGWAIFTIDNPPPFAGGGAGRFALKLAAALQSKGHQITILTPHPDVHQRIEKWDQGVQIIYLPCLLEKPEWLYSLIFNLQLLRWLTRHRRSITAIHMRGMRGILTLLLFARWAGINLFLNALSEGNWHLLYPLSPPNPYRWAVRKLLEIVPDFVAQSDRLKGVMIQDGIQPERIVMIPNGTDIPGHPRPRKKLRAKLGLPEHALVVLYVGRLHEQKDIFFLLRSWEEISRQKVESQLVLLGAGPQEQAIKHFIRSRRIDGSVRLPGFSDRVGDYLDASDLFVLPSRREGCSNALLEAMAHGLACIATDSPGNDEIIENEKNGFLIPFGDQSQLTTVILRLMTDPETCRSIGQAARERIGSHFSLTMSADRHEKLYDLFNPQAPS